MNYGSTPAKILFLGHVEARWCSWGEELPAKPQYGAFYDDDTVEEINVQWLAPLKDMHLG